MDTVEHFARKHGCCSIIKMCEMLNGGMTLKEIGAVFHLSESQVCRLRSALFRQVWVMSPQTKDYLEFIAHIHEREAREVHELVNSHLRLIQGGGDA